MRSAFFGARAPAFLCVAFFSLAVPAHATSWPKSDIPPDSAVTFGELPNGMRYALMHNNTPVGAVSIRLRIDAGSMQEAPEQRGLAHFIEHMAFRGSAHAPDGAIEKTLAKLGLSFGTDINASTDQDQTVYQFDLPQSDPQTLETALDYMREIASYLNLGVPPSRSNYAADMMAWSPPQRGQTRQAPAPVFLPSSALTKAWPGKNPAVTEAGVVLSELRLRDVPAYRALEARLNQLLVDSHATALPSGNLSIVAAAPLDQLRAFYNAYYRPGRATLIVVGDIDPAAMQSRIQQLFGDWIMPGPEGENPVLKIPLIRGVEAGSFVENGAPTTISLSWLTPPEPKPQGRAAEKTDLVRYVAMRILNRRFQDEAAGAAHPFDSAVVSRGQALHAVDIATLSINYGSESWQTALKATEAIRQDYLLHGVTSAEVARTLTELRASYVALAAAANTRLSSRLARAILDSVNDNDVFTSPQRDLTAFETDAAGLDAAMVSATLRQLFAGGGPVIFVSGSSPVAGGDGAVKTAFLAAEKAPPAPRPALTALFGWPHANFGTPGRVVETREVADLGASYVRFANGVRLILRPSRLRADQVLVSVKIGGGRLDMPRDRATAAWAAPGALIRGGLSDMSYTDMQRVLASKIYAASFSIGEDGFLLSGATLRSDLDTQLQVLAAYLTQPGFRPEGFTQTQAQFKAQLQQLDANPSAVFSARAPQYLHQGDMRWKFPSLQDIQDTKAEDVRALVTPAFAQGPVDIIITGDIGIEATTRAVAATFGALAPRTTARATVTQGNTTRLPAAGAAIALAHSGSPGQDIASLLWPTPGRFPDIQDDVTQSLMATIMQERLFDKLRGEGITYGAQVGGTSSKVFDYGFIQAFAQIPRDQTAGFDSALDQIVLDLKAGRIAPDELESARAQALENLQRARESNEYWLSSLDDTWEHPEKLSLIRDYEADLRKVTVADIAATARKYLLAGHAIRVNVGQPS